MICVLLQQSAKRIENCGRSLSRNLIEHNESDPELMSVADTNAPEKVFLIRLNTNVLASVMGTNIHLLGETTNMFQVPTPPNSARGLVLPSPATTTIASTKTLY